MVNKELKRLSRRELVDIIYQLKKNEQELQEENDSLKKQLDDKHLKISNAGSIADAAVNVTDIFATAQKTADLYLQEIADMKTATEKECSKKVNDADNKVRQILADGQRQLENLNVYYQAEYKKWKKLREENMQMLKKDEVSEDITNG